MCVCVGGMWGGGWGGLETFPNINNMGVGIMGAGREVKKRHKNFFGTNMINEERKNKMLSYT